MPPDVALVKPVNLKELELTHLCVKVSKSKFHGRDATGRKLSILFSLENSTNEKMFHLKEPVIVKIEERPHFCETLSGDNLQGFAFKELTKNHLLFLKNATLQIAVNEYHKSKDDYPEFLYIRKA